MTLRHHQRKARHDMAVDAHRQRQATQRATACHRHVDMAQVRLDASAANGGRKSGASANWLNSVARSPPMRSTGRAARRAASSEFRQGFSRNAKHAGRAQHHIAGALGGLDQSLIARRQAQAVGRLFGIGQQQVESDDAGARLMQAIDHHRQRRARQGKAAQIGDGAIVDGDDDDLVGRRQRPAQLEAQIECHAFGGGQQAAARQAQEDQRRRQCRDRQQPEAAGPGAAGAAGDEAAQG